ncbi:MAG TPA: FKBP-type peptidyl-prolyl cis-trans isomerase [Steroidobacteraceae bacterium]|nr:FKBP-type peptidyl-prolyl cis-trans isomerase [Steroidobacteraceae bacterium]
MRTLTRYAALAALAACTAPALAAEPAAMDEAARMQYALGYQLGKDLAGVELRPQDLQRGLEDGRSGAKPKLSEEEMGAALMALQERVTAQRAKTQAAESEKAIAAGQAYLDANARKPGVTTTASGLQYRVVTGGSGAKPKASDTVTVHYKGTLVDGTEFDSSYKRGQPASFPVSGVIPGWTEALQLMPIGSKFELAIPPALAYGSQGPLANQVLLFEVELLGTTADSADAVQK